MVYLIDLIGVHCGMHYYLDAFKQILESVEGVQVGIVSNYSDSEQAPVLLNQYKGGRFNKMLSAVRNLFRLRRFIDAHPDDRFIYLTYGTFLDPYFMPVVAKARYHCVDIHEALAQNSDSNTRLRKRLANIYSNKIRNVISHSGRTDLFLEEFGFRGRRYEVPHFKYVFPREFDAAAVPQEMKDAVCKDRINLLFFGNITREKGVDILLEAVNLLSEEDAARVNVIVAGKDIDGACRRVPLLPGRMVNFFTRHISDDELIFLYRNVDFLALPYRKTSQSGILEMAFYFKKPIIASDIPYFRKMLSEFPSFGMLCGKGPADFAAALRRMIQHGPDGFFSDEEYARYENRKEVEVFKIDFQDWLAADNIEND